MIIMHKFRYYDVQYLGHWLNNEVLSKLTKDNQVENLDVMDMPLISKGVIKIRTVLCGN